MLIIFSSFALFATCLHPSTAAPAMAPPRLADPIVAEATAMGSIAERVGVVLTERKICSIVVFRFDNWLDSRAFTTEARKLITGNAVSEYNALVILRDVSVEYLTTVREQFANITVRLPQWKGSYNKIMPNFTIPKPVLSIKDKGQDRDTTELTVEIAKTLILRDKMERAAEHYKIMLGVVVHALRRKTLDSDALEFLGGDEFFRDLAQEILGKQSSGGLIDEFGSRNCINIISLNKQLLI